MRFIFLLKWFFWDEIILLCILPIGENFSELVGPKIVNIGIPEADIRWPHPVSFEIPNLQVFEILIVLIHISAFCGARQNGENSST